MRNTSISSAQIKAQLLEMIQDYHPGTRLSSRAALAESMSVNKATVDRAIAELIGEGVLYSKNKSGTYIADTSGRTAAAPVATRTWAVLIPNIMCETYPGIFRGIEDVASAQGIYVMLCNTDNNEQKQNKYIDQLLHSGVEGMLILPSLYNEYGNEPFRKLMQTGIPFVLCNRNVFHVQAPCVRSNNFYGTMLAMRRLLEVGCKNIAFIGKPMYSTVSERHQGYVAALAEAGMPCADKLVRFDADFEIPQCGYESTAALLQACPETDGIFCFNDEIALGAYKAIADAGRTVGGDIAVIGYDNTPVCDNMHVPLSSVDFMNYDIGHTAAQCLSELIEGKREQGECTITLTPQLVVRKSCALHTKKRAAPKV